MKLSFSNINLRYGDAHILKGLGATIEPASFTALIGPNGTGKSSLLKAIAGLVPASGDVFLGEEKPLSMEERNIHVAYMQQDVGPTSSLTVIEVVLLGRVTQLGFRVPQSLFDEAFSMLHNFGVASLAERTLAEISGGQRQLVYVAQALFRKPKVLLLDEPTAALDLRHQLIVLEALKNYAAQHNIAVMAAMHDLTLSARFADNIICLSQGHIESEGNPSNVLTSELIERVYGVRACVSPVADTSLAVVPIAAIERPGNE